MTTPNKPRVQAHNLTGPELESLQQDQVGGIEKTTTGTDGTTTINVAEKHLFHVELEIPLFHQTTGQKLSRPFIQKFTEREFTQAKNSDAFSGYTVNILHNPTQASEAEALTADAPVVADLTEATALGVMYKNIMGGKADPNATPDQMRADMDKELDRQAKSEVERRVQIELAARLQAQTEAPAAMAQAQADSISPTPAPEPEPEKKGPGRQASGK